MTKAALAETRIGIPGILNYTQGTSVGFPTTQDVMGAVFRDAAIDPKTCSKKQLNVLCIPIGHGYRPVVNQERASKIEARRAKQAARYDDRSPKTFCVPLIARNLPAVSATVLMETPVYKKKYGIPLLLKRTEVTQIAEA